MKYLSLLLITLFHYGLSIAQDDFGTTILSKEDSILLKKEYYKTLKILKKADPELHQKGKNMLTIPKDTLSQYPDSLFIDGKVIDYQTVTPCGVLCLTGYILVKLKEKPAGYPYKVISLDIPCLESKPKRKYKGMVYKLSKKHSECHFSSEVSNFHNFLLGIHFYTDYPPDLK